MLVCRRSSIAFLGFLIAISVIAPSFQAVDLIKVPGIGTVAIGFALQDILQNLLAGFLLLLQEPVPIGRSHQRYAMQCQVTAEDQCAR